MDSFLKVYGTILKRETLSCSKLTPNKKYLMLKSSDPFPDYYCSELDPTDINCKIPTYYLPYKSFDLVNDDRVFRLCLETKTKFDIDICSTQITLNEKYPNAFRIKGDKIENKIDDIVDFIMNSNVEFYKSKIVSPFLSKIYLKSVFNLKELKNSIFQNSVCNDIYYFKISEKLDWAIFEKLITYLRSINDINNVDFAIGYWYDEPKFVDFVRIYSKNIKTSELISLQEKFEDIYNNYKQKTLIF